MELERPSKSLKNQQIRKEGKLLHPYEDVKKKTPKEFTEICREIYTVQRIPSTGEV
jgi:hypothetical protein